MSNPIPAILLQDVYKNYGKVRALRGVNLEVQRGEIFGFLGPNGAGKTTTIRLLLDLIRPASGILRVLGLDPQKKSSEVRRICGYLPGELHLDETVTVGDSLRLLNRLRDSTTNWKKISNLAERLDLSLRLPIKNLSKGNKQKIGIVQALMHQPDLLLMDEPTAGLDPLVQQEVYRMLREAQKTGATVFFSSHILGEVQEIAERVAIIRQGKIIEIAKTDSLINRSFRRIHITFKGFPALETLNTVSGVTVEHLEEDHSAVTLRVEGEMDGLIKALADYPVRDLDVLKPTLEEIFLAYYEKPDEEI
jgi:ABC-2 type transport system ATP-binding protein